MITGMNSLNVRDSRFIPAGRSGNSQQIQWTKEHAFEKMGWRTRLGQNSLSDDSALMKFSTESVYRAGLFSLLFQWVLPPSLDLIGLLDIFLD